MFEGFEKLLTQEAMSVEQNRSMSWIQKLAMRRDFPKAARMIGSVKFYDRKEVDRFFADYRRNYKRVPKR
jgi:hypothetical protein